MARIIKAGIVVLALASAAAQADPDRGGQRREADRPAREESARRDPRREAWENSGRPEQARRGDDRGADRRDDRADDRGGRAAPPVRRDETVRRDEPVRRDESWRRENRGAPPPRVADAPRDPRREAWSTYGRDDRRDGRRDDRRDDWRDDNRGDRHRHYDRDDERRYQYRDARGRGWRYDPRWYHSYRLQHYRYDGRRYYSRDRYRIGVWIAPRGYVHRVWIVGDWLPYSYYNYGRYDLHDYWRYDLYEPPYWARWVRVRDDALLIDRDSGEIIDVVYDVFW